jgi:hypothetical protein
MKNKKQIVEDLVNTFNDRDHLHTAYKKKLSSIIYLAIQSFLEHAENFSDGSEINVGDWCDQFVERTCRKQEE